MTVVSKLNLCPMIGAKQYKINVLGQLPTSVIAVQEYGEGQVTGCKEMFPLRQSLMHYVASDLIGETKIY